MPPIIPNSCPLYSSIL